MGSMNKSHVLIAAALGGLVGYMIAKRK